MQSEQRIFLVLLAMPFFGSIKVFRVPADAQEAKFVLMLLDSRCSESIRRYTFICLLNVAQCGRGNRSAHLMVFNCYCPLDGLVISLPSQ